MTIVVLSLVSPLTARATPSSPAIATPTDTSPTNPPDGASSSSTTAPAEPAKTKTIAAATHGTTIELGARVYVRGAFSKEGDDPSFAAETAIQSARLEAEYRWHQVRTKIEVELHSRAKLKTTYVQLRLADGPARVDVRAGNFKMPFSAIQQESIWTLPMADRGLIDNVFVNRMQLAGRAVGANLVVRLKAPWRPELRAGVFQGTDDAGNPLSATAGDRYGQDAIARASVRPIHGFELGAAFGSRAGELLVLPATIRRQWAAEVDATAELELGPARVRGWAEAVTGTSWLVADPMQTSARFVSGRAIGAVRFGGAKKGRHYVEPYALAGAVDPDTSVGGDFIRELTGGVGVGAWDRWQLQAELEVWRMGDNAPVGIAIYGLAPTNSTTALIQFGARL